LLQNNQYNTTSIQNPTENCVEPQMTLIAIILVHKGRKTNVNHEYYTCKISQFMSFLIMMQDQKLTELTWRQYYHVHHRMVLVKVDMLEHSIKSI